MHHNADAYATSAAHTATPGRLIVLLYERFGVLARRARVSYIAGDIAAGDRHLTRAGQVITELHVALDLNRGELARNLASLYVYIDERLRDARGGGRIGALDEAIGHMDELASAWATIAATPKPTEARERPVVGVNLAG